mgnify:FL=1
MHTSESARQSNTWEYAYVAGASASVLIMGSWSFIALVATSDPYAHLVSFWMTIAFLLGVFGRNFGSGKFVVVQILCAWIPLSVALLISGDIFYITFAILLAPFFLTLKFISDRFRNSLLDAIAATHRATAVAQRFDTALTNMPHGLCMLDGQGRILVANERFVELLNLGKALDVRGWRIERLLRRCVRQGGLARGDARRLLRSLETGAASTAGELIFELRTGVTLAVTRQPMERGGVVAQVQDISERRRVEQMITRMANFDALTELPNRNQFHDCARSMIETCNEERHFAVHFIDLDYFKQVNDMLGHSTGDELLRLAAQRLRSVIRRGDIASRLGGDEFVVLQGGVGRREAAEALARRLVEEMSKPYNIAGEEVVVGASVGVACFPHDGADVDQLLRHADMALYEAKGAGRGVIRFFEDDMQARVRGRRDAETNLRNAIDRHELDVYFQPSIDLRSGRIVTCEALLRWNHPERGLMPAGEFIEIAEETGAIVQVGELVLEKACRACRGWPADVNVAVNVSPRQFDRADVSGTVRKALAKTGLSPNRLEIEITESAFLRNITGAQDARRDLKELGVRVSLDDFGTGYSSLSYLHSFPFDKVKIDRSFVANLVADARSLTLLVGAARLSADLGLRVTVEGIETLDQLALVRSEPFFHEAQAFSSAVRFRQLQSATCSSSGERVGSRRPTATRTRARRMRHRWTGSRTTAQLVLRPDDSRIACAMVNAIHLIVAINLNS